MFKDQNQSNLSGVSRSYLLGGLMAVLSLTAAGCSSDGPKPVNPKQVTPVSGIIHVDGEPRRGVGVRLVPIPLPEGGIVKLPTIGKTNDDGKFELTTYYQNDGAPIGEYGVLFDLDLNPAGTAIDHFQGKYSNRAAPEFKLSVKGGEESIDMELIELESP